MARADTIAAVATAPGRGGIGVVRISGYGLEDVANAIVGKPLRPRFASLSNFYDQDGSVIDQGIALYFPAPHSFTGEDVLELQGHGGNAVMQRLLKRCLALGARLAEPGEFTKRAFINDKLDLAQAESVADLIDAASEEAAKSAVRSLQGEFSHAVREIVGRLIDLRLLVEASIDFPDEDIDFLQAADAAGKLSHIQSQLQSLLAKARQGSLLREGVHVVLVGQPNVGKSSLLNQLAGDEVAIVTAIAGTTRDTVREEIEIQGVPFHIIDTAGLRDTSCEVEQIGIARTWAAVSKASLALLLLDSREGVSPQDEAILGRLPPKLPVLRIYNKIDLVPRESGMEQEGGVTRIYVSAKNGAGMDLLQQSLLRLAGWEQTGEGAFMARERHLRALKQAHLNLESAADNWHQLEFFAEELKLAQNALSSITGEFGADDLLGEIFSRFCIGK
ncbi:MAG: tRNA uridine-5-carboxymethylaminomethyl(34) synthesis GTPase MnmE [Gammaproteobacteria bacterium]|nr:tRNA uridine-5-carboxymethylaminomethyl(34) synthesis GTPase MnmE [Gammaproteobacteria bacterium]MBU1732979.1 tRNA uridine-5-carboxymethylaminomethyl(34) synthesis GTPase MnmE [Gammaproteobacteria bacterium]MBU1892027.1 tRNA uridine-5-carboxymethylaminomethyl(34) synthesis GTPase MnmE [Gammaproteobacteria bacterium]